MKPIDLYTELCLTTLIRHVPVIKYSNRTVIATTVQIIEGSVKVQIIVVPSGGKQIYSNITVNHSNKTVSILYSH